MRIMEKYKSPFWYCLYVREEPVKDEYGNETGGRTLYREPTFMRANVSPATGAAQIEQFGNLPGYDKVILTDDTSCPINENTALFLDKEPEFDGEGNPLYDYRVKRVARSKNFIAYAVSRVSVS